MTLHRPANVDARGLPNRSGRWPTLGPSAGRLPGPSADRKTLEAGWPRTDPGLITHRPIGYLDFLALMDDARVVLTDSGGIQEETTASAFRA